MHNEVSKSFKINFLFAVLLVGFTGTGKQQQKTGSNYRTFPQQMKQVFLLFITRKSTLFIEEEGQFFKTVGLQQVW